MKDLAPRTGVVRAPPYKRPPVVRHTSASVPALLHPGIWKPTTTITNPIDSQIMCTRIRRGRIGPDSISIGTTSTMSTKPRRKRTSLKLTPGFSDPTSHRTSLRSGTGDIYITPAPADLIGWKHQQLQFHPQPPPPLLATPSSHLLPSLPSSVTMSYHHTSMVRSNAYPRASNHCSPSAW